LKARPVLFSYWVSGVRCRICPVTASITVVAGVSDEVTTVSQARRSPFAVANTTLVAVSWLVSAPATAGPRVRARASAGVVMVSADAGGSLVLVLALMGLPPRVSRRPFLSTEAVRPLRLALEPPIFWVK
jgi:hypothetical protein